jgi:hypothetical protein
MAMITIVTVPGAGRPASSQMARLPAHDHTAANGDRCRPVSLDTEMLAIVTLPVGVRPRGVTGDMM